MAVIENQIAKMATWNLYPAIKKARIAQFLKEYWNVRDGGDRKSARQNGELKKTKDIANFINESKRTTERLIKLNDLIPRLKKRGSRSFWRSIGA